MLTVAEKAAIYDALAEGERLYLQVGSMVSLRGKLICSQLEVGELMREFRDVRELAGGVWGRMRSVAPARGPGATPRDTPRRPF